MPRDLGGTLRSNTPLSRALHGHSVHPDVPVGIWGGLSQAGDPPREVGEQLGRQGGVAEPNHCHGGYGGGCHDRCDALDH